VAQFQRSQALSVGAVSPSEPARAGLSSEAAPKVERTARKRVELISRAAHDRLRQHPAIELHHLLNSSGWADAMWHDGGTGLSVEDMLTVLIGIGWICPAHLTEMSGDDINGLFCAPCEFKLPAAGSAK